MKHSLRQFNLSNIVQKQWPKLTDYVHACGPCLLLSHVPEKTAKTGTIILAHTKVNGWEIASFRKDYAMETVNKLTVPKEFVTDFGFALLPDSIEVVEHHEKAGRPAKYDHFVARRLAMRRERGESIRSIAQNEGMSPSTVQRLINSIWTPKHRKEITARNARIRKERFGKK